MGDKFSTKVETPPLLVPLNSSNKKNLDSKTLHSTWESLNRQALSPQLPSGGSHSSRNLVRYSSVQTTVRALQLDHSNSSLEIISYLVALILLIVFPVFQLVFVEADNDDVPKRQMAFQPVVLVFGVSRSLVSFVFLSRAMKHHGIQGFLFLDSVAVEVAQIRKDYDTVIERGSKLFVNIFVPCFILYILQLMWLHSQVTLAPLPFPTFYPRMELILVVAMKILSWVFQTTTFLYACVLFWKVCKLQELKMEQYHAMLLHGLEAEYYVLEYERIRGDLKSTSKRFRRFLALTGIITVSGTLTSMYEVVESFDAVYSMSLWGELFVLTVVNLTGAWLCLSCASKIAHLHQRIVKRASSMHAKRTLAGPMLGPSASKANTAAMLQQAPSSKSLTSTQQLLGGGMGGMGGGPPLTKLAGMNNQMNHSPTMAKIAEDGGLGAANKEILERIDNFCQRQDAFARRSALVDFLTNNTTGISIYGFVVDRFFVHASVGTVLTTTWFILGRSLQA